MVKGSVWARLEGKSTTFKGFAASLQVACYVTLSNTLDLGWMLTQAENES